MSVAGEGTINLGDETFALRFKGDPKKFRLVRAAAPITVTGGLRSPKFGIDAGAAVAQLGIGAALAGLLTPLAAVLPFVDAGLEKDANCVGLIQQAQVRGTPVKTASTTQAKPPKPKG